MAMDLVCKNQRAQSPDLLGVTAGAQALSEPDGGACAAAAGLQRERIGKTRRKKSRSLTHMAQLPATVTARLWVLHSWHTRVRCLAPSCAHEEACAPRQPSAKHCPKQHCPKQHRARPCYAQLFCPSRVLLLHFLTFRLCLADKRIFINQAQQGCYLQEQ